MRDEIMRKIHEYGKQIDDLESAHKYADLYELLQEMKSFLESNTEVKSDTEFYYYLGTGFSSYSDYLVRVGKDCMDEEVVDIRRSSLFYFRKALELHEEFHQPKELKLYILTNYANALDTVDRIIEALNIYRKTLEIDPDFSMARGNYGITLRRLAGIVNDKNHYNELHCYAYQAIKKALSTKHPAMHEQAVNMFQRTVDFYERLSAIDVLSAPIVFEEYPMGGTDETAYRKWCLNNHLFLNPLNEVIELESAFAHDPLTIKTYTEGIDYSEAVSGSLSEPPRWFAMLNQLKEEYAYARYLCYEGIENLGNLHYADREVELSLASYDYCNYSIRLEQIKSAFRILYSMLDQICFMINDFWKLGLSERQADAYHICKAKNYPQNNGALLSLYWVLCEFFEQYGDAKTASEKKLAILRNAMEHKFIKIHEFDWDRELQFERDHFYHVSEHDLKKHTLRLLEISREALMYLVYAIGINESRKEKAGKVVSMELIDFPDEWKR